MDILPLLLRIAHTLLGLLWVGLTLTITSALGPTMLALGLSERRAFQLQFLPRQTVLAGIGAIGTLLTGLWLGWVVYGGATGIGFANDRAYWILLGAALAMGAWTIGLVVFAPGGKRMMELLNGQGDPAEIPVLGAKLGKMAPVALFHMLTATACMLAAGHGALFSALNVVLVLALGLGFGLALLAISRKIKA